MSSLLPQEGDLYRHLTYSKWIWEFIELQPERSWCGLFRLVIRVDGAQWPENTGDPPRIGDIRSLGYLTLDPINEMEAIALMAL